MRTLKFNKKYYLPILIGDKTQTLRRNNKRLREGEIVKAIFPGIKMSCKIKITKTGYKQFKYLNIEDAQHEGYSEISELKNELLKFYPSIGRFDRLYYYRFKVL